MKTALIGYPIGHSLSPAIHNAAYEFLQLDWHYSLLPCRSLEELQQILKLVTAGDSEYIGLNVTTPWKQAAFAACGDNAEVAAKIARAANVLALVPDQGAIATSDCELASNPADNPTASPATAFAREMTCYNTDGRGVTAALRQAGAKLQGDAIVICGTGAVAAITTLELLRLQAASITVVSRDSARAAAMLATIADGLAAADMAKTARHTKLVALSYADTTQLEAALSQATVIIDATTRGKDPNASPLIPVAFIGANHLVLDVNYQSCSSALLREAGKNGAICLDGLDMLVEQAALSIEIWAAHSGLRLTAPRTLMRKVAVVARQARDSTKQLVEE